jgi:hypothetical protein
MNKEGLKISLTNELSEEIFFNALCNSLDYMCSGYGLSVGYAHEHYKNAKANLTSDSSEFQAICYEDILMQILRDGNFLTIEEDGSELEDMNFFNSINLADVHERVKNVPLDHLLDMINENDDAVTGDVVLQTVFLNEIVYG